MLKLTWLKQLVLWIFNNEGRDKDFVLKTSITGIPLVKVSERRAVYQTKEGMDGAHTIVMITQFGSSTQMICDVLKGYCDHCLSQGDKQSLIKNISKRVAEGGRYLATVRNKKGNLDFVDRFWDKKELETISGLLKDLKDGT